MNTLFQQFADYVAVTLFRKEVKDVSGDHNPDIGHFLQVVNRRLFKLLKRTEMSRQTCRCRLTHFANPQRIQEAGKRRFFGFLQRVNDVLRGLRSHSIEPGQLTCSQAEQIGSRVDILFLDQLVDDFIAHPVHI
ncbi:hypothetical protein D3C72_1488770 [compost metagenome]